MIAPILCEFHQVSTRFHYVSTRSHSGSSRSTIFIDIEVHMTHHFEVLDETQLLSSNKFSPSCLISWNRSVISCFLLKIASLVDPNHRDRDGGKFYTAFGRFQWDTTFEKKSQYKIASLYGAILSGFSNKISYFVCPDHIHWGREEYDTSFWRPQWATTFEPKKCSILLRTILMLGNVGNFFARNGHCRGYCAYPLITDAYGNWSGRSRNGTTFEPKHVSSCYAIYWDWAILSDFVLKLAISIILDLYILLEWHMIPHFEGLDKTEAMRLM